MRKALKSSNEVFHYWANQVQSEGRSGNVFFNGDSCFSYGRHFCIARILPSGAVAFTTRIYSNTTAAHIRCARSAARHYKVVFCHDPANTAAANMRQAQEEIVAALGSAEAPRILQRTRDARKAAALLTAANANAYLAALPEGERGGCTPFDTSNLEYLREVMLKYEAGRREREEIARIARMREAEGRLNAWIQGKQVSVSGFSDFPVALRVNIELQVIQTSRGADIPVSAASSIWPMIEAARRTGRDVAINGTRVGHYMLEMIRANGSIVVGCHDIPYSEIYKMAESLGLISSELGQAA
jgi:hypothetical protein